MHYAYRFQLKPTAQQRELLDYRRDTCRQLYNHALREFNKIPESAGTLNHRVRQVRDQLTDLKDWWDELNDLYSTVAQAAVMRIEDSITALGELKDKGYNVGSLNWNPPETSAVSHTSSLASSSTRRTVRLCSRCRNSRISRLSVTDKSPTMKQPKKSRSRKNRPESGMPPSSSTTRMNLPNRRWKMLMPRTWWASTWAF